MFRSIAKAWPTLFVAFLFGCSSDSGNAEGSGGEAGDGNAGKTSATCEVGSKNCPCDEDGNCDDGLECLSNHCVDLGNPQTPSGKGGSSSGRGGADNDGGESPAAGGRPAVGGNPGRGGAAPEVGGRDDAGGTPGTGGRPVTTGGAEGGAAGEIAEGGTAGQVTPSGGIPGGGETPGGAAGEPLASGGAAGEAQAGAAGEAQGGAAGAAGAGVEGGAAGEAPVSCTPPTQAPTCSADFGREEACGGDERGEWTMVEVCTNSDIVATLETACDGATGVDSSTATGNLSFSGTSFVRDITINTSIEVNIPATSNCMVLLGTCNTLETTMSALVTELDVACEPDTADGCNCLLSGTLRGDNAGLYEVDRETGVLTIDPEGETIIYDYCIADGFLTGRERGASGVQNQIIQVFSCQE